MTTKAFKPLHDAARIKDETSPGSGVINQTTPDPGYKHYQDLKSLLDGMYAVRANQTEFMQPSPADTNYCPSHGQPATYDKRELDSYKQVGSRRADLDFADFETHIDGLLRKCACNARTNLSLTGVDCNCVAYYSCYCNTRSDCRNQGIGCGCDNRHDCYNQSWLSCLCNSRTYCGTVREFYSL